MKVISDNGSVIVESLKSKIEVFEHYGGKIEGQLQIHSNTDKLLTIEFFNPKTKKRETMEISRWLVVTNK